MARAPKLKVYRTPIGFHDAYVAAGSQKAALKAWGTTTDLFARGVAETIDDPDLIREPLAKPGTVIKRSRGSAAEQIAALPPDRPKVASKLKTNAKAPVRSKPPAKPKPRPSRSALDEAETAIADEKASYESKRAAIAERQKRLADERRALDDRHEADAAHLQEQRAAAEAAYERAIKAWRG